MVCQRIFTTKMNGKDDGDGGEKLELVSGTMA